MTHVQFSRLIKAHPSQVRHLQLYEIIIHCLLFIYSDLRCCFIKWISSIVVESVIISSVFQSVINCLHCISSFCPITFVLFESLLFLLLRDLSGFLLVIFYLVLLEFVQMDHDFQWIVGSVLFIILFFKSMKQLNLKGEV